MGAPWLALLVVAWVVASTVGRAWYRAPLDLAHTLILPPVERDRRPASALPGDSSPVVIVDVSADGREGAPIVGRQELGRVIRKLGELGAWVVGVDILFETRGDAAEDRALEQAIRGAGCVVLATRYDTSTLAEIDLWLAPACRSLGMANIIVDESDGYFRMIQHLYTQPGIRTRHSLSLEVARMLLSGGTCNPAPVEPGDTHLTLRSRTGEPIEIPVDHNGMSLIQYQGPAGTVPQLHWRELQRLGRQQLNLTGRAALVGDTRLDTRDSCPTPFHRSALSRISGVEIHGQTILGMLGSTRRRVAGPVLDWTTALIGTVLGAVLLTVMSIRWAIAGAPLLLLAFWIATHLLFASSGVFVNPLPATVGLLLGLTVTVGWGTRVPRPDGSTRATLEQETLERVDHLLEGRRYDEVVHLLQGLDRKGDGEPDPHLRWGLAMAFLANQNVSLGLAQVKGLGTGGLPLDKVYRLACLLEQAGLLAEAETVFAQVMSRDLSFADVAGRARALAERDYRVPDSLRRALCHRYGDVRFLASGGMGKIYQAHDRERGQDVAIKVPSPELLTDRESRVRFGREIELLSRLSHPNIIRLHDVGKSDLLYYSMELMPGTTLRDLMRPGQDLPAARAVELLLQVSEALAVAHGNGVIHRDIKPENILLDEAGVPRLTDFGLAFIRDQTRLSRSAVKVGTPAYMAPEQLRGDVPSPAVDVYAIGVVLFEALCGVVPYDSEEPLARLMSEAPVLTVHRPEAPEPLVQLVARCLSRDPARRPPSGRELADRLRTVLSLPSATSNESPPLPS
ncbi:MAG: protein kinase [Candidatus Riflebacteria bacterium]|nr:protein kinase [Candidatus Riflebacteria bacterium]